MIDAVAKPAEMKSPAGKYPALPYTIKLKTSAAQPMHRRYLWYGKRSAGSYIRAKNPYVVNGYIAGTTIPASIKITPADPLEYMDGVIDTNGDTYIQVSPSDGNHGNKDVIRIKNYEGEYKRIGVVQFDFKSMNISDLTEMTLRLYFNKKWMRKKRLLRPI